MMETVLPKPNDGFVWVQAAAGPALVSAALDPFASHLFTTRAWSLGAPTNDADTGWVEVAHAMNVEPTHLVHAHQVHGATVIACKKGDADGCTAPMSPSSCPTGDILVANDPDVAIAIQTADCVPILIADMRIGAVAAAHAGWRGLAAGVPRAAVDALARHFGSRPGDLVAAIGPSISAQRYEVDTPVRERFDRAGFPTAQTAAWFPRATRAGHCEFDGWAAARDQLVGAGVPIDQIALARLCTASHPDVLCSYRRDGKRSGRLAAVIRARR
jgi:YfiH family protein